VESVGFQFLSLRHSICGGLSPPGFQRAQIANNGGLLRENLRTALTPSEAEILSLGPFLSKPSDFADLVRFS
jgi:hypothetical protein